VGLTDVMSKLIACRLLEPALRLQQPVRLICREGTPPDLLAELALHNLDMVLSDTPAGPEVRIRVFNHLLGECGVTVFGKAFLAERLRKDFPNSMDGEPFLLPIAGSALRRSMDQWFEAHHIRPRIVGEMADSALIKAFGASGIGLFPAPSAIEKEVRKQYDVRAIGRIEGVCERYYAISAERKLKNPAVIAISESARSDLFL
jgi:LysR family transcriptional regulator, transcriptional activator of nhaA